MSSALTLKQTQEIKHFTQTGDSDPVSRNWPGGPVLGGKIADAAMIDALVTEIRRRATGLPPATAPVSDQAAFVREKISAMVAGLFPKTERDAILAKLEQSVVFVTTENLESVLRKAAWPRSKWDLANMYLLSINAEALSESANAIVGMAEDDICYVAHTYFSETEPFADFVVHEVAHLFHKFRRDSLGLKASRTKKYLLQIKYNQTETFAYACEAYNQILKLSSTKAERIELAEEIAETCSPPDVGVDLERYHGALKSAAAARNGWKKILEACCGATRPKP